MLHPVFTQLDLHFRRNEPVVELGSEVRMPQQYFCLLRTLIAASALLGVLIEQAMAQGIRAVEVSGTEFRVLQSDGKVLTSHDLVGAVLALSNGLTLRIDAVETDPKDEDGEILLHTFSVQAQDGSWRNLCEPGPDGRQQGFPLAGRALSDGRIVDAPGAFEIVCTAGAQGKCVRFGYKPWKSERNGQPMRDFYNACVHMVRADYCGDGAPTTKEGTLIDLYDRAGIQHDEPDPGMTFEAAWAPAGAVCLARVRIPENTSIEALTRSCPRLRSIPLGEACSEGVASAMPDALLFNKSQPKN
ncbi:MAG: hypothetical protein JJE37_11945 [Methyloceanibacter sp.]|nr:hypothetical protein [Methyloceanibacter sp.]